MQRAQMPVSSDDAHMRRLTTLNELSILDTPPESGFDDAVLLATQICQTPVALVSLVTDGRQWFKARIGFPACETPLSQSVCAHALQQDETFIIPDLTLDERTRHNTLVTGAPFIRFYAGALLHADGVPIGTLCVIDTKPRPEGLTEPQRLGLEALARQVMVLLEMRRKLARHIQMSSVELAIKAADLENERQTAELREQFMGILGHDLRNPLAAINAGLHSLGRTPLNERGTRVVGAMQQSVARMTELISNMLDFTRARLGGGIPLQRDAEEPLQPVLEQIIRELQDVWPHRLIETNMSLSETVDCDHSRIGQLLSNLLSNALAHGDKARPIKVSATTHHDTFELSVANFGDPIPSDKMDALFKPFSRGRTPGHQGLGLGLHIASEIARAHDGIIDVTSVVEETRFTFRMPLLAATTEANNDAVED